MSLSLKQALSIHLAHLLNCFILGLLFQSRPPTLIPLISDTYRRALNPPLCGSAPLERVFRCKEETGVNGATAVSLSRSWEEIGYLSAEEISVANACTKMNTFQAPTHTHSHDLIDIVENGGSWWRWALVQRRFSESVHLCRLPWRSHPSRVNHKVQVYGQNKVLLISSGTSR